jgi:hypothetical protein
MGDFQNEDLKAQGSLYFYTEVRLEDKRQLKGTQNACF